MIERVAVAINQAMLLHDDYDPDLLARAAIVAMREPTKAMKEAGFWDGNVALHTYRAMIDAALGEEVMTTDTAVMPRDQTANEGDDKALIAILEMHEISRNADRIRAMRDAVAFGEMKARNKQDRN